MWVLKTTVVRTKKVTSRHHQVNVSLKSWVRRILSPRPFRQMYEGFQPGEDLDSLPDYVESRETPETNPELSEEISVEYCLTEESRLFEFVLCEYGSQNQRPG